MRTLFKLSFLLVLISPLVAGLAVWFALSGTPLVSQQVTLSHEDIARAKSILRHHDPRRLPPGAQRDIDIGLQDLNLAANYLVQRLARGNAKLSLQTGQLQLQATLQIPRLPWRPYLNVDAAIDAAGGHPEIHRLQIGGLVLPGALAEWLVGRLVRLAYDQAQLDSATSLVRNVQFFSDHVRVTYRWNPALIDQARDGLLTPEDRAALRHYLEHLVDLQSRGIGTHGSLGGLLPAMFAAALERSREQDPVTENIALLTVLGTWAGRQDTTRLVPGGVRPQPFRLKLQGRTDFAQHFLASAALAARGDSALSDAVGLFKELSDTDRGSGFSFTDLAADRAGTRFGEFASASATDARQLQQRLADGISESDIMPPALDLPEHMDAQTFGQRYGEIGSPAYRLVMDEIEQRIATLSLYTR